MENLSLPSSLITQGLFWGQEVASLSIIILPKKQFSNKANYLLPPANPSLQSQFCLGILALSKYFHWPQFLQGQ